jgi:hypothetical protein
MRSLSFIVSVLLAGSAYAQSSAVFTPTQRDLSVPTYINATVVKVDNRNHTIRFRSASGEVSLAVDSRTVRDLGRLRAGDEVVLGYTIDDRGRQVVTAVTASEASRGVRTAAQSSSVFSTVSGRVVSADPASGTIVLSDALGRTEMLSVQGVAALGSLAQLSAGQQVNVAFTPGAAVGGVIAGGGVFGTVNSIQPVQTPTFVTGSISTFDPQTGSMVLRTPFGDQTFLLPASGVNITALRPGENVRLNLSPGANERTRTFTSVTTLGATTAPVGSTFATPSVTPVTTIGAGAAPRTTGTVVGGTVAGGAFVPGATGVVSGAGVATVPPTTANFAGTVPSAIGSTGSTMTTGAGFNAPLAAQGNPAGQAGVGATAGQGGFANTQGGFTNTAGQAGINNATGLNTANVGLGTGTLSFPGSPFGQVIPQLPSMVGQLNVVPPPTGAPAGVADTLPVGAMRDVATRDYDYAVHTLALKANEIDAYWFRYRDGCLRSSSTNAEIDRNLYGTNRDREWYVLFTGDVRTPADDNCRQLALEMTRMANDWRENMSRVEDTARKNDVLPGAMREIRDRYRVDF